MSVHVSSVFTPFFRKSKLRKYGLWRQHYWVTIQSQAKSRLLACALNGHPMRGLTPEAILVQF
jgi:hypothetical protein